MATWRKGADDETRPTAADVAATSELVETPVTCSSKRNGTAQFATAVTRSEFGRFYWNGKLAKQLAEALDQTHRPTKRDNTRRR